MTQYLSSLPLMVYAALAGFFQSLRKDERGLSGVVVAVLLILVAILAIVLVWAFLGDWIVDMWDTITEQSDIV